jgi:inhibitor of cysteine peptidase
MRALAATVVSALAVAGGAAAATTPPGKVALHVGDEVSITLSGNPSTGYTWKIASVNRDILKLVGRKFVPSKHKPGIVGAGGTFVFRFRALKKGHTTLQLVYEKPYAPKEYPSYVRIDVTVKK